MREALQALQQARTDLQQAPPQFAGHRQKAIDLVDHAIQEINTGMQFAAQQGITSRDSGVNQQSYVQPMASGVNSTSYPMMADAQRALEQARNALQQASHNFGGHRTNALQDVNQAMQEITLGMQAAGQR